MLVPVRLPTGTHNTLIMPDSATRGDSTPCAYDAEASDWKGANGLSQNITFSAGRIVADTNVNGTSAREDRCGDGC